MERIDDLLKKLSESYAVSGQEGKINDLVQSELSGFCDSVETDQFGNIIALKKGKVKGSAVVACHIDEIGFTVKDIEGGYIKFDEDVGCDGRILPGQRVVILTEPPIFGVVGTRPPHYTTREERGKVIPLKDLFVDTGLGPEELKSRVKIGDVIGFHGPYLTLQGCFRSGKSFDNRVGVTCGIEILRQAEPYYDLYLVLSVQEEFSGLGAMITGYRIDPNFAIVIDCTHGPHPSQPEYLTFEMDKGPVFGTGPTLDRRLLDEIKKLADARKIPYRIEALPRDTGTDADSIAFTKAGIRTMLVQVPIRYMHSPVEVVCIRDINKTVSILKEFLSRGH